MTPTPPTPAQLKELQLHVIRHIRDDAPIAQVLALERELQLMRRELKARPAIVALSQHYLSLIQPMQHSAQGAQP